MKKLILIIFFISCFISVYTQRLGIGTNTPDSSAILDIRSTNKGVLLPKVNLVSIYDSITVYRPVVGIFLLP